MTTEHAHAPAGALDWPAHVALEPLTDPVDDGLIEAAVDLAPGKALELGCGRGQNSVWLARRGWAVTAVDGSFGAIEQARQAAEAAAVTLSLVLADISAWRPTSRFDLVVLSHALPARGQGRSRTLEVAISAVAPGGFFVVSDLDVSLGAEGWMAEKYLVSRDELERHLDGFRILRSTTRLASRRHGYQDLRLPVAHVVACRRTDLRTL
jgi:SAM-dependent methyltransferase